MTASTPAPQDLKQRTAGSPDHPDPSPHPDAHPGHSTEATSSSHPTAVEHPESPADPTNNVSRIMFFVMLAIIVGAIAIFLILHPRPPG